MSKFKVGDRVLGIAFANAGREGVITSINGPWFRIDGEGKGFPEDSWELIEPASDPVNSPAHYASGEIECIDAIKAQMSAEQFKGYLRGNIAKYVWRYEAKGGAESLEKARWYLDRLIAEVRANA